MWALQSVKALANNDQGVAEYDPADRFANRRYETPSGITDDTAEIAIEGWWDM